MQSPWSPHLGSALQLVHRWIICCLASGALGGTNELSQRLGHIFDSIYQNHLEKRTQRETPIYHSSAWESSIFNASDIRCSVLITTIKGQKKTRVADLCLGVIRADAGSPQFDHICELGNGFGRRLGCLRQLVLTRGCSRHQHLCVLDQSFGCLQYVFPEKEDEKT